MVRGVFLLEVVATAFRLGWLYLATEKRVCSNYLLNDQQQLGKLLVGVGAAVFLFLVWKLMWGRFNVENSG